MESYMLNLYLKNTSLYTKVHDMTTALLTSNYLINKPLPPIVYRNKTILQHNTLQPDRANLKHVILVTVQKQT